MKCGSIIGSLLEDYKLSPRLGQGSECHLMQGKHQHPAADLSPEMYYCVTSVRVFIIRVGGEDGLDFYLYSRRQHYP